MKQSYISVYIPVTAHIALCRDGRNIPAQTFQFPLILQGKESTDIRNAGFLKPGGSHHLCAKTITGINRVKRDFDAFGEAIYQITESGKDALMGR